MLRVFVLGSGSSGNAVLIEAGDSRVLIDAGIGPKSAAERLESLGSAFLPRGVDAIVPTHHHGDHFAQVERLARATNAPVWVHPGIAADRVRRKFKVHDYAPGRPFHVGPFEILAEPVPHDAPQVALRVAAAGRSFGIATDVGRATKGLAAMLGTCDAAMLEANHCPELLTWGPYPEHLKRRVRGGLGHLSNQEAGALAASLVGTRLTRLYLGHLSRSNNTPERALETVAEAARGIHVAVVPHGQAHELEIVPGPSKASTGIQLALF